MVMNESILAVMAPGAIDGDTAYPEAIFVYVKEGEQWEYGFAWKTQAERTAGSVLLLWFFSTIICLQEFPCGVRSTRIRGPSWCTT